MIGARLLSFLAAVAGVDAGAEASDPDVRLRNAVVIAVCTPDATERGVALGRIAEFADHLPIEDRQRVVTEMASDIAMAECEPIVGKYAQVPASLREVAREAEERHKRRD